MLTIFLSEVEDRQMRSDPRGTDAFLDDLLKSCQAPARENHDEPVHTVITRDVGDLSRRVLISRESPKQE